MDRARLNYVYNQIFMRIAGCLQKMLRIILVRSGELGALQTCRRSFVYKAVHQSGMVVTF
jgi:hypothetical protein